jgi:pyruvate dehydrogenase E2 component (dihydrolipoamide acetyltransferase)
MRGPAQQAGRNPSERPAMAGADSMAIEFKLPELGPDIKSGTVFSILVGEGDTIEAGQAVVEVETDKATVPVECPHAGTVEKIHIQEGDDVAIGATILSIAEGAGGGANGKKTEAKPAAEKPSGDAKTKNGQASSSSEAAKTERGSKEAVSNEFTHHEEPEPAAVPATNSVAVSPDDTSVAAGPAARRLARQFNINLGQISGSGRGGRVTPDDVVDFVKRQGGAPAGGGGPAVAEDIGRPEKFGPVRVEKLSKIRLAIARQMSRSKTIIPHLTNFDDADVTDLERLRKSIDTSRIGEGIKLTTMPFIIKAVALSLKEHARINASIDVTAGKMVFKEYVHIGIAVDTERGLVVLVLRDVDKKGIPEITRDLADLANKARHSKFTMEDTQGGSFTISNMGAIGGTYSTPVINYPESAILLLGRTRKLPVVIENDQIVPRQMMPLSLSYDHRSIDGADAARFLNSVKGYLQSPGDLLMAE